MDLKLDEWFHPASLEQTYSNEEKDRILAFLIAKGSSFPAEISRHLLMDLPKVNAVLIQMTNDGILSRITPDENYPQPLIKCRIVDMWALGIFGYPEFIKRSWFHASEKGYWYYADKFAGEHRRANVNYLETFPNIKLIFDINNPKGYSEK